MPSGKRCDFNIQCSSNICNSFKQECSGAHQNPLLHSTTPSPWTRMVHGFKDAGYTGPDEEKNTPKTTGFKVLKLEDKNDKELLIQQIKKFARSKQKQAKRRSSDYNKTKSFDLSIVEKLITGGIFRDRILATYYNSKVGEQRFHERKNTLYLHAPCAHPRDRDIVRTKMLFKEIRCFMTALYRSLAIVMLALATFNWFP